MYVQLKACTAAQTRLTDWLHHVRCFMHTQQPRKWIRTLHSRIAHQCTSRVTLTEATGTEVQDNHLCFLFFWTWNYVKGNNAGSMKSWQLETDPWSSYESKSVRAHKDTHTLQTHTPHLKQGQGTTGVLLAMLQCCAFNQRFDHWQWIQTGHAKCDFIYDSTFQTSCWSLLEHSVRVISPSSLQSKHQWGVNKRSLQGLKETQDHIIALLRTYSTVKLKALNRKYWEAIRRAKGGNF